MYDNMKNVISGMFKIRKYTCFDEFVKKTNP